MKNLIFFLLIIFFTNIVNAKLKARTNSMKLSSQDNRTKIIDCGFANAKNWSHDVAYGLASPWGYSGGQYVTYNGILYQAMWGGTEVPGTKYCDSQKSCSNIGDQWITVGKCNTTQSGSNSNSNSSSKCSSYTQWSQQVANGNQSPYGYSAGQQVAYNRNVYQARWGGSEVPGSNNASWAQWFLVSSC